MRRLRDESALNRVGVALRLRHVVRRSRGCLMQYPRAGTALGCGLHNGVTIDGARGPATPSPREAAVSQSADGLGLRLVRCNSRATLVVRVRP